MNLQQPHLNSNGYFVPKKFILNVILQYFWDTNLNNHQIWYSNVNKYELFEAKFLTTHILNLLYVFINFAKPNTILSIFISIFTKIFEQKKFLAILWPHHIILLKKASSIEKLVPTSKIHFFLIRKNCFEVL